MEGMCDEQVFKKSKPILVKNTLIIYEYYHSAAYSIFQVYSKKVNDITHIIF